MSEIHRAGTTTTTDITITDPDHGLVLTDNVGDQSRIKIIDDEGVKTIAVEELS